MFGRKIIAASIGRIKYETAVARARGLFMINVASKIFVEEPKSAPRIKGIVFFRLINLEVARGTKSPIVIEDEKTIPVKITPKKYALYFEEKYFPIFSFVFSSPPKMLIIDLLKYRNEKIKIANARSRTKKILFFERRRFIIGEVRKPTMSGKGREEVVSVNSDAINNEEREMKWKKYSNKKAIKTMIALKIE